MRFAVHRPGVPAASPRSHRMPCGDISCCIYVRIKREVAGHAGEERLALAALRCYVPARRTTLAGERSFNLLYPVRRFVLQATNEQTPAGPQDSPIQPGFLTDVLAGSLSGSSCRAGHALDAEVFDSNQIEPPCQAGAYFLGPVLTSTRFTGFQLRDGQLRPGPAVRAALGPRQPALQTAKPMLPLGVHSGSVQHLTRRQRRADHHAPIDAYRLTITGRGNGPRDNGECDMPTADPIPGHPVGLRSENRARPAEPHPARLGDPHRADLAAQAAHMPGLHRDDTEPLVASCFPPAGPAVGTSEEPCHCLGEIPQRLLLYHLAAVAQPREFHSRGGELAALIHEAGRSLAPWAPPGSLLDRKVPHVSCMSAMVPQHHLLGERREQAKSGHTNILANAADILGEVQRRSFTGLESRKSTSRSS